MRHLEYSPEVGGTISTIAHMCSVRGTYLRTHVHTYIRTPYNRRTTVRRHSNNVVRLWYIRFMCAVNCEVRATSTGTFI